MELSSLKRDTAAVEGGQWVGDIPNSAGLRLRVRGMSSKAFQATLSRLTRGLSREDRERDGSPTAEASVRVLGEAIGDCILLEWDGLTEVGEPLAYTPERAKAMLPDPKFEPFLDCVVWAARVVDNGRATVAEETGKNSPAPSA